MRSRVARWGRKAEGLFSTYEKQSFSTFVLKFTKFTRASLRSVGAALTNFVFSCTLRPPYISLSAWVCREVIVVVRKDGSSVSLCICIRHKKEKSVILNN